MAHHFTQRSSDEVLSSKKSYHKGSTGSPRHAQNSDSVLKRSFSTPDTAKLEKAVEEAEFQRTVAAEKKRNKLGYHRTSIACSHCRRRKIRCIASPDTPNRCINCIRLKKECSFYPVDQQPGPESRPKATSRQKGDPSASPTPSSPAVGAEALVNISSATRRTIIPASSSLPVHVECFSDPSVSSNGLSTANNYAFTNPTPGWVPTEMATIGASKSDDHSISWHAYPTEPSMNGQFSPYAQTPSASVAWTSGASEAGSHDDMSWCDYPTPIRSLSYSGESNDGHTQSPFMPLNSAHQAQQYDRRQSNLSDIYTPYPTSVAGMPSHSLAVVNPSTAVPHAAPFTSGVNPWQQQQQQQILAAQGPVATWQYGGVPNGGQPMLIDGARVPAVTQAPSGVYYST